MDETYIKVKGQERFLYRAYERIEAFRSTLMLSHVVAFFDSQESLAREVTRAEAGIGQSSGKVLVIDSAEKPSEN